MSIHYYFCRVCHEPFIRWRTHHRVCATCKANSYIKIDEFSNPFGVNESPKKVEERRAIDHHLNQLDENLKLRN